MKVVLITHTGQQIVRTIRGAGTYIGGRNSGSVQQSPEVYPHTILLDPGPHEVQRIFVVDLDACFGEEYGRAMVYREVGYTFLDTTPVQ